MAGKSIDWDAIHREYVTGQFSNRELGRQYGVSHVGIAKHAEQYGWVKNLAEDVRKAVTEKLVTAEITGNDAKEIVERAAERGVEVILRHRGYISQLDRLKTKLADKAEAMLETVTDLNSLDKASAAVESLARTTARLIPLERRAFNLDDPGSAPTDALDDPRAEAERKLARLAERVVPPGVSGKPD